MNEIDHTLANEQVAAVCRSTAALAGRAIDWFRDNPDKVGQELPALMKEFRKYGLQARKLEAAAHRPMCVGVFGPSQAGKSYLISALARRGTSPLIADFDGVPDGKDFVREINPEGGQEATGLVTRFSIRRSPTPAGFPVALRLLSQTDIIKIIGNTFLSDCDLSEEEPPNLRRIREVVDAVSAAAQAQPVDSMTAEDVYELQEYFDKYFKGEPIIKALSSGTFWSQAADLAPRLPITARAALFSLLWGGIEAFTELFRTLYGALEQLGFPAEAYAPIEALIPREVSIINVQTLGGLGRDEARTLQIRSAAGRIAELPRSWLTALIAELRITVREKPWDFFEHTDLLDFPGARSRESIPEVRRFLEQPDALQGLYLRGKVAYLFDRYCAEQELTSMLLCIGPSNQEVRTLPAMVDDWINSTHGPDPALRATQQTALFLVLTKFDAEFEEKAGQSVDSRERWTTRLNASLLDFFGKAHGWPREWSPGEPFRNSFWLRNPNFKAKHIINYDADGEEIGLRPGEEQRISRFRQEYLENSAVQAHFADPGRAWDEAFELNDGGVAYLAECLAPVCNPDIKRRQIEVRVGLQRAAMRDRLARYFTSGDLADEVRRRRAAAANAVRHLAQCAQAQRFGELLRAMQLDDATLADLFYEVEILGTDSGANGTPPKAAIGQPVTIEAMLGDVFGDDAPDMATVEPPPEEDTVLDHAGQYADAVVRHWFSEMRAIAETGQLCNYFRMPEPSMSVVVSELIAGARRLALHESMAERVRDITAFRQKLDQAVGKPALVAAHIVNAYVNWLGFDGIDPSRRPTVGRGNAKRTVFAPRPLVHSAPSLPSQPTPYDQMQYVDWLAAFMRLVEDNASTVDGREIDVQQNARIGALIGALDSDS